MLRFRKPNERERDWLAVIPVGLFYLALSEVIQEERAFLAALSIGAFYVIISREWERRREGVFWTAIFVFALIHLGVLARVEIPHDSGASLSLAVPFIMADGFAMWCILNWLGKRSSDAPE